MAIIQSSDIKVYLSGGAGNTDPDASLGGVISTTELTDNSLHNLFDKVTAAQASAGETSYRAVYIKNENASLTYEDVVAYISSQTTSSETSLEISVATEAKNTAIQTIVDETTAPSGQTFISATGVGSGQSIGDLATNDYKGLWVKWIVDASATAFANDTAVIATRGETTST